MTSGGRRPFTCVAPSRMRGELDLVTAAQATAAVADALAGAGSGAVTEAAEVAEADAFAATAAAFADAREAEAAGAERVADGVAEHVAARALLVLPGRLFAAPRSRRRVRDRRRPSSR